MHDRLDDEYFFNYGWEHFWCDPKHFKNYDVREIVKGPFLKSKIVYSIPYVTFFQLCNTSVRLREGIPDCWAEYLTYKSRLFREYLQKNDLMHKECLDIIPRLRKKYRLYIGQGIPNPWTSYSYIGESETVCPRDLSIENTDKCLCHLSHCKCLEKKSNREPCICCKKKYLFECPDECNTESDFCFQKTCNGRNTKAPACCKICRCNEFLKNPTLKPKNKQAEGGSSKSSVSNSSDLGVGDENQNLKENKNTQCCECIRTQKARDSNPSEKSSNERLLKPQNRKKHLNVCFCPYIKSCYLRRTHRKNCAFQRFLEPTSSSKLIQAEIQPVKISKTSQTEHAKSKTQIKCMCSSNKCIQCNAYQCKTPWLKPCCPAAHSISCLCYPLSCPQNPAFICPYFFSNNFLCHNYNKIKSKTQKGRIKRNQHKEEENDDEPYVKTKTNHRGPKIYEKYDVKGKMLPKINYDVLKTNRNIYCLPKYWETFDHLKNLTDEKLRRQNEVEISSSELYKRANHSALHLSSGTRNFCGGNKTFYDLRPEKLKTYSYYKPRHFDSSFMDGKMSLLNYNNRRCNYSDQATMTITQSNDSVDRNEVFNERVEGKESRAYGLSGSRALSIRAMKKRRKLLINRKRRKKLAAGEKVSFLEYQALLNKQPKELAPTSKQVQMNESDSDDKSNLKFRKNIFQSENITGGTWKKSDKEISGQNGNKLSGNESYEDILKRPLRSELQFGQVVEKISCSSGNS